MKTSSHLTILAFSLLLAACQKSDMTPAGPEIADLFPLAAGNEWTYDIYTTDPDGEESLTGTETLKVTGIETINGEAFFKLEKESITSFFFPEYLRVSGDQLIDDQGAVWLSLSTMQNVFQRDTIFRDINKEPIAAFAKQLEEVETLIKVPAGEFSCLKVNTRITSFDPDYLYGERVTHDYYSENVGLVQKNLVYYNSDKLAIEIRLSNFSIE